MNKKWYNAPITTVKWKHGNQICKEQIDKPTKVITISLHLHTARGNKLLAIWTEPLGLRYDTDLPTLHISWGWFSISPTVPGRRHRTLLPESTAPSGTPSTNTGHPPLLQHSCTMEYQNVPLDKIFYTTAHGGKYSLNVPHILHLVYMGERFRPR